MPPLDTYWRKTRRLTLAWLLVWFLLTFVVNWYASELNAFTFAGFPLGFYMSAQGCLLLYLIIVWCYNRQMRKLDAKFDVDKA